MKLGAFLRVVAANCCLISFVQAPTLFIEESLAEHFKVNGITKWEWDPKAFCKSVTPHDDTPQLNFRRAYILTKDVMLEQANCSKIEMETVHCEYDFINAEEADYAWRRTFYANSSNGSEIFLLGKPSESICNDEQTWVIKNEIVESVLKPERRLSSYDRARSFIFNTEELLAGYFNDNGLLRWHWNPKLFCHLQVPFGYSFHQAYISEHGVTLRSANNTPIKMEVMRCKYTLEFLLGLRHYSKWHYYAVGPNGEIFYVSREDESNCDDEACRTIQYEILGDESTIWKSAKLFGLANIFEIFVEHRKGKQLRQAKWFSVQDKNARTEDENETRLKRFRL